MPAPPLARLDPLMSRAQPLADHLLQTGKRAAAFSKFPDVAELTGRWHDLGKFLPAWQADLHAGKHGRDHSSAGAHYAASSTTLGRWARSIAWCIAGHHGGLKNRSVATDKVADCVAAIRHADKALLAFTAPTSSPQTDLDVRMLYSALVDADRLDAEAFEAQCERPTRNTPIGTLVSKLDRYVALKESVSTGKLTALRKQIRLACENAAHQPPGMFTLTVPTGGGKTLSGMSFALRHAQAHSKKRIIVAIPFTSIIEQTAQVYESIFGKRPVLEHHSAVDPDSGKWRQGCDNWDVPIVVTTTVQLFESLHSNRPGRCRKLHNIANSVIIIDEAQTLPLELRPTIDDVMLTLIRDYGCTIVLSTASQPPKPACRDKMERVIPWPIPVTEIIPAALQLEQKLERVRFDWSRSRGVVNYSDLAQELAALPSVLAITHRRRDAQSLLKLVDAAVGDESTQHLSTTMCAAHRTEVLATIKKRSGRVVSTQLVEAGVDFSFPVVYRALAGLDSLLQAAGRCNREGEIDFGDVRVFKAETSPPSGDPVEGAKIVSEMRLGERVTQEDVKRYFDKLIVGADCKKGLGFLKDRKALDFESAAGFRMIENDTTPVYVPWKRGAELLAQLRREGPSRGLMQRLQRYVVNMYRDDYTAGDVEKLHQCEDEKNCECPLAFTEEAVVRRYSERLGWMLSA